jgi:para-aminobenzoate synthetase component 1
MSGKLEAGRRKIWVEADDKSFLQALTWARLFPFACYLDGNGYSEYPRGSFPRILAIGTKSLNLVEGKIFENLQGKEEGETWFGYLSYDLKNELFDLESHKENRLGFPLASFFMADVVLEWEGNRISLTGLDPEKVWNSIQTCSAVQPETRRAIDIRDFQSKESYCQSVEKIKDGIRKGHVYEVNYCRYFECGEALDGLQAYLGLRELSPSPFSGWYKTPDFEIASASPERFLKKSGRHLITQPIKGTAPRRSDPEKDRMEIRNLLNSEKERAENLMIVDLVRNDLARVSVPGSTTVTELFGIYSFPQVHQMTSTVESDLRETVDWTDVLRSTFPMGSMTGAPKLEVMKWIDDLETQQRGAFSGALGCIGPENDFDFNVLIRSLFINHRLNKAGFAVGSAITIDSIAEQEWEECENKASAIRRWLEGS